MSKSIKLKDSTYIDSTGIVHNRELLSDLLSRISLMAYPIGSIYISINSTNPSTLFGGTWEQIKDRFLLACGSTYKNGTTGGEATHKLTIEEMPNHTHTEKYVGVDWFQHGTSGDWNVSSALEPYRETGNTGGSQAHNNMPPYLAVYMWKRTA